LAKGVNWIIVVVIYFIMNFRILRLLGEQFSDRGKHHLHELLHVDLHPLQSSNKSCDSLAEGAVVVAEVAKGLVGVEEVVVVVVLAEVQVPLGE
jgi:hypothetical protein